MRQSLGLIIMLRWPAMSSPVQYQSRSKRSQAAAPSSMAKSAQRSNISKASVGVAGHVEHAVAHAAQAPVHFKDARGDVAADEEVAAVGEHGLHQREQGLLCDRWGTGRRGPARGLAPASG